MCKKIIEIKILQHKSFHTAAEYPKLIMELIHFSSNHVKPFKAEHYEVKH